MQRSRILTVVAILLAWAMLAAFGNVSASQNGKTRFQTSSADILPTPTPPVPKGTPPPKTITRPPSTQSASGTNAGRSRRVNLDVQSTQAPRQPAGSWQLIYSDGFETGNWPYSPWTVTDLSNDGYDRKWGRSNYWGFWGLWPAAGGAHSVYPPTQYANNLHTRMRYGPFDLRDAKLIDLYFWLWRDIEDCCDYLVFEASVDGVNFQELGRWTGYVEDWQQPVFYLDQYAGQSQVWVAWRFYSNASVTYAGPWVDDVEIWKYVPGQVTVRGSFHYNARDGQWSPARSTKVYLYDSDPGGTDDLLAITTTSADPNANGYFQFSTVTNWDDDDSDPDPNNRRLDLYIIWETDNNDSPTARRRVTDFGNWAYQWSSGTRVNVPDGTSDFFNYTVPNGGSQPAMWIFQDLLRAWEYVRNNSNPQTDPGSVTARWEDGQNCFPLYPHIGINPCNSFFWPDSPLSGIFIRDDQRWSPDTIIHELGHQYMYNARGSFWYSLGTWNDFFQCVILGHGIDVSRTELCAWTEGWGNFLPLAVNGDPCYDFDIRNGSCGGIPDRDHFDLETHGRNDNPQLFPWGDTVEGRVAGALYDLMDPNNEVPWYDSATFGFAPIWNIVRTAPHENRFREFWNSWETSGHNRHHAVRAIYQNTIDYDDPPAIDLPNQPVVVLQNFTWIHALDLWGYSSDDESADAELGWQILNVTDARCGVSLDSHWVNIAPQQGWLGSCDVTISVSDSIKASTDTFRVNVVPVASRNFLPIILK